MNSGVPPQPVPQPLPFAPQPEALRGFNSGEPQPQMGSPLMAFDGSNQVPMNDPSFGQALNQQQMGPQQQMLSQMQNRGFSSPQPQQIQPAPQQQMAGGYGSTGSYQGDQFSRGVMSLPQIQDNFYSPPAGGYTAPPITSPYSMF